MLFSSHPCLGCAGGCGWGGGAAFSAAFFALMPRSFFIAIFAFTIDEMDAKPRDDCDGLDVATAEEEEDEEDATGAGAAAW